MGREICEGCDFGVKRDKRGVWCELANVFAREFAGIFCPRENDIETIKQNCANYIPPEEMADKKNCCLAHLTEERAHHCWIKNIEDLRRDEDFKLKKSNRR